MKLSDLIIQYRTEHGMSQRQFAASCGLSNGYISMLEKEMNPATGRPVTPTMPQLKKLSQGLHMTVMELFDAVDDMPIDFMGFSSVPEGILPLPNFTKKPRLGVIACGDPILALQEADQFDDVPDNVHCDFTLQCKGDSMINARIFDGDIVYIRQQEQVESGEIAAVLVDDEATLKRVRLFDDHISLEPENPMFKPLVIWGEDMNRIRILGKAVAFTSTVR